MSKRHLVLDTETTGFKTEEGHRLVEIGAVELVDYIPTGETYHVYINPERDVPQDAFKVHGLSEEFLSDKPKFAEVADGFLEFIRDDSLVIHNAPFDMGFLNFELSLLRKPQLANPVVDTLVVARQQYRGRNSLDALCDRLGIDRSRRTLHGALLDAEILSEVFLKLIGRDTFFQKDLTTTAIDSLDQQKTVNRHVMGQQMPEHARQIWFPRREAVLPSPVESERHEAFVASLKDAIWLKSATE